MRVKEVGRAGSMWEGKEREGAERYIGELSIPDSRIADSLLAQCSRDPFRPTVDPSHGRLSSDPNTIRPPDPNSADPPPPDLEAGDLVGASPARPPPGRSYLRSERSYLRLGRWYLRWRHAHWFQERRVGKRSSATQRRR